MLLNDGKTALGYIAGYVVKDTYMNLWNMQIALLN